MQTSKVARAQAFNIAIVRWCCVVRQMQHRTTSEGAAAPSALLLAGAACRSTRSNRRGFRNCGSVLARIRGAEVHSSARVVLHRLSSSHPEYVVTAHIQQMTAPGKIITNPGGHAIFDHEVASGERKLSETRLFHCCLDIHALVDDIG